MRVTWMLGVAVAFVWLGGCGDDSDKPPETCVTNDDCPEGWACFDPAELLIAPYGTEKGCKKCDCSYYECGVDLCGNDCGDCDDGFECLEYKCVDTSRTFDTPAGGNP